MPLLLGLLSALGIGVSDWFGGYASRRSSPSAVVGLAMIAGTITCLLLTIVVESDFLRRDVLLGAASGMFMGLGLMLLYSAISVSSPAIASPIVAVFVTLVPVGWDVATGGDLAGIAVAGIAVAVVGVLITTMAPDLSGSVKKGVLLALLSGVVFSVGWTMVGQTSIESGLWAAVAQRFFGFVTMILASQLRKLPKMPPVALRSLALASGTAGGFGVAAYVAGTQRGSLSTVAVASAMFPVVTVLLAVLIEKERLRWWQTLGVATSLAGIALLASA